MRHLCSPCARMGSLCAAGLNRPRTRTPVPAPAGAIYAGGRGVSQDSHRLPRRRRASPCDRISRSAFRAASNAHNLRSAPSPSAPRARTIDRVPIAGASPTTERFRSSKSKSAITNARLFNSTVATSFTTIPSRTTHRWGSATMEVPKPPPPLPMLTSSSLSSSSNDQLSPSPTPPSCSLYSTVAASPTSVTAASLRPPPSLPFPPAPAANPAAKSASPASPSARTESTKSSMDDEYGAMSSTGKTYVHPGPYRLESHGTFGHAVHAASSRLPRGTLDPATVTYNTYGTLNEARDNAIVVCHALTGNADLEAWWGDLLGPGRAFDTDRYLVVCCNILGSCYGSAGPSTPRPGYEMKKESDGGGAPGDDVPRNKEGTPIYGMDFPDASVRDTVRLQLLLLRDELKINSVKCVIGGSFGGMQAVEYLVMAGASRPADEGLTPGSMGFAGGASSGGAGGDDHAYGIGEFLTRRNGRIEPFVRSAIPIACGASHTAWQIGISETQRQAVYADPKWEGGRYDPNDPPRTGLSVARQVAMVSYRTPLGYHKKFGRALVDEAGPAYGSRAPWQVKSYLEYQGRKFLDRFDPVTYVKLTGQMDSHEGGGGRGGVENALGRVEVPVCVLGIDSDVLYPLREQEELVACMPRAELKIIHSDAGHDGFLLEQDQVAAHIKSFLYSHD
ncbi:hypothetical protein ACHAWF_015077 [Thalassiosira exigua]